MSKTMFTPRSRKDFLKQLYENDKYKLALASARTTEERQLIVAMVGEFVGSWADILAPIIVQVQKDPTFAVKLGQVVNETQGVITSNESASSGSLE